MKAVRRPVHRGWGGGGVGWGWGGVTEQVMERLGGGERAVYVRAGYPGCGLVSCGFIDFRQLLARDNIM